MGSGKTNELLVCRIDLIIRVESREPCPKRESNKYLFNYAPFTSLNTEIEVFLGTGTFKIFSFDAVMPGAMCGSATLF
jgi:hypothetical protein